MPLFKMLHFALKFYKHFNLFLIVKISKIYFKILNILDFLSKI